MYKFVYTLAAISLATTASIAVTKEKQISFVQDVDKQKRMELYKQCKAAKRNNCHTESFKQSIIWRAVNE